MKSGQNIQTKVTDKKWTKHPDKNVHILDIIFYEVIRKSGQN